jgi:hypothetical protein
MTYRYFSEKHLKNWVRSSLEQALRMTMHKINEFFSNLNGVGPLEKYLYGLL